MASNPSSFEKEALFFDGQVPVTEDLMQIINFSMQRHELMAMAANDYGAANGLSIQVDAADPTKVRVTAGYGWDKEGVPLQLSGMSEPLALADYTYGAINRVVASRQLTEDTPVTHPDDHTRVYNTRRNYSITLSIQATRAAFPAIDLGYVIARGSAVALSENDIVMDLNNRDVVHSQRRGSGTPTATNPHGLTAEDLPDYAENLEEHRRYQHAQVSIYGTFLSLQATVIHPASGADYLSMNDVQSGDVAFIGGKKYVKGQLVFTEVNTQAAWASEGANSGVYYIYVDTTTASVKKQRGGTAPETTLYSCYRDPTGRIYDESGGTASSLTDRRVFSSILTEGIRHGVTCAPTIFQGPDPNDNLPGYTQRSINEYLYDGIQNTIRGIGQQTTGYVTPDANGILRLLAGAGMQITESPSSHEILLSLASSLLPTIKVVKVDGLANESSVETHILLTPDEYEGRAILVLALAHAGAYGYNAYTYRDAGVSLGIGIVNAAGSIVSQTSVGLAIYPYDYGVADIRPLICYRPAYIMDVFRNFKGKDGNVVGQLAFVSSGDGYALAVNLTKLEPELSTYLGDHHYNFYVLALGKM